MTDPPTVEDARNWLEMALDFLTDAHDGNETVFWVIVSLVVILIVRSTLVRIFGKRE